MDTLSGGGEETLCLSIEKESTVHWELILSLSCRSLDVQEIKQELTEIVLILKIGNVPSVASLGYSVGCVFNW